MPATLMTADSLVFIYKELRYTIGNDHPKHREVRQAIQDRNWDKAARIVTNASSGREFSAGKVEVNHGHVFYNKEIISNTLTKRILDQTAAGFDTVPMMMFLSNLMENPSFNVVEKLYDFMEQSMLPITDDGHFLAYKRVNEMYTDIYSGLFDNAVGATLNMDRNKIADGSSISGLLGLSFYSLDYIKTYGIASDQHIMIIKINPKDVVYVPVDYIPQKSACCSYEVIGEHAGSTDLTKTKAEVISELKDENHNEGHANGYMVGEDQAIDDGIAADGTESPYADDKLIERAFVRYDFGEAFSTMDTSNGSDYRRGFREGFAGGWEDMQTELKEEAARDTSPGEPTIPDEGVEAKTGTGLPPKGKQVDPPTSEDYKTGYEDGQLVGEDKAVSNGMSKDDPVGQYNRLLPPNLTFAEVLKTPAFNQYDLAVGIDNTTHGSDYRIGFRAGFLGAWEEVQIEFK